MDARDGRRNADAQSQAPGCRAPLRPGDRRALSKKVMRRPEWRRCSRPWAQWEWERAPRRAQRRAEAPPPQPFLISIFFSALTASGLLAAVTFKTPLSKRASTLLSSIVSGSRTERAKLPKLRSHR